MVDDAQISEAEIEILIPCFYARVCDDALIGPVFNDAIDDWKHHLKKLVDFWSSVMLTSGRYKGNPVAAHLKHLPAITPPMFDRWLSLWTEVTSELLSAEAAVALQNKAARIAESLKLALYFRLAPVPGVSPQPGLAAS
jgi:hemoglobin